MSYFKPFLLGFFVTGFLIVVVGLKAEERSGYSPRSHARSYPHQNSSYHVWEQANIAYEYGFALPLKEYYFNPDTGDVSTTPQAGWKEVDKDKKWLVTIQDVSPDDLP